MDTTAGRMIDLLARAVRAVRVAHQRWPGGAARRFSGVLYAVMMCAQPLVAAAAERYRIDPQHTYSSFEYEHWGLSLQRGRFDGNTGVIDIDSQAGTGAIAIEIDAASISTGSSLFDRVLRSGEFFDVATFPSIGFKSTALHFEGDRLMRVDGILTIKGTARAVTLQMTRFECRYMIIYGKRACGANGFARLSRSDFELGRYIPFVSDLVTLYVSVEAIRED